MKEEINRVNLMLPAVAVKETGSTLEVNLVTGLDKRDMLHEVLHVLEAEGTAEVLSASYCNVGDKIFYTIYSQAIWPRIGIETSKVRERLKELVSEFNQDLMEDVMDTSFDV
ncbi:hypothetical protein F0562_034318 [Nyssa sinensis]|uniref:Uncharacterized protein n=1 Tax=Nyssa sinensis TaxID=561372 RepID=A0A5J5AI72_9ASTE|nr:hypothetical protein F0562_034318 [Nyssa sinensis]